MADPGFLEGRAAVVTGGLSGQGRAIANALAARGASVAAGSFVSGDKAPRDDAAHYPAPEIVGEVRAELARHGAKVHAAHLDVRDTGSIRAFLSDAAGLMGPPDILVNSAGTTVEHPVCGHPDALWDKVVDTNLTGAFRMIRECLPGMIGRRWGRIINIGSTAATVGWKDNPAYCASKAGLLGLTRCVALEGAPHRVSCVMISPTWVETELMRADAGQIARREGKGRTGEDVMTDIVRDNPQGRMIQPGEIAELAAHICREESLGITMANIQVTGGALW